jgi:hypothetical protein
MIPIKDGKHALPRTERAVLGLGIEPFLLGIPEGPIVPYMRDRSAWTCNAEMVHRSDTAYWTGLVGVDPEDVLGYGAGIYRRVSGWFISFETDKPGPYSHVGRSITFEIAPHCVRSQR